MRRCTLTLALVSLACAGTREAPAPVPPRFIELTIDRAVWTDAPEVPAPLRDAPEEAGILCHVVEWEGFEPLKRFTAEADKVFLLEADGVPTLEARAATGGVTTSDGSVRFAHLWLRPSHRPLRQPDVDYTLRPRNAKAGFRWNVSSSLTVGRSR